jgi:hypothetical protein
MHFLRSLTVTVAALAAVAATPLTAHAVVSETPAGSASFNGTVRAVATYGTTVFVAGNFTRATDDRGTFVRRHLAAVDSRTGRLLRWHPRTNAGVYAIAASNGSVFIGGTFTSVNGHAKARVAKLSVRNGAVATRFRAATNKAVRAISVTRSRVYLGGDFTRSKGKVRNRLAAYSRRTNRLIDWRPRANGRVTVLRNKNGLTWVGGSFTAINGHAYAARVAALRPAAGGVSRSFRVGSVRPVTALRVTGSRVYVGSAGVGGHLYATTTSGRRLWHKTFDGDVDAIGLLGNDVYVGGHFNWLCDDDQVAQANGDCAVNQANVARLAAFSTSGSRRSWAPHPDSNLGVLAIGTSTARSSIYVGGDFLHFNRGAVNQPRFAILRG